MNSNLAYQDDFDGFNDFLGEMREELIDGKLFLMAPAATNHVLISGNIYNIFSNYLKGKKCVPFHDGVKVFFNEKNYFVPDMMVVCDTSKIKPDGVHGVPDFVAEVLSPSTMRNDRTRKKAVYELCGVREYWIVSPGEKSVEQYLLQNSKLMLNAVCVLPPVWMPPLTEKERGEVVSQFQCGLFPDLKVDLEDVFYRTF